MRQNHVADEKMFVDYAGVTLEVLDSQTKCNSFMTGNCNGYSIHSPRYRREI
jgi:hypothetical protein